MGDWIEWKGGPRPVQVGTNIQIQLGDDTREEAEANEPARCGESLRWRWITNGQGGDIIAYRVVE